MSGGGGPVTGVRLMIHGWMDGWGGLTWMLLCA